MVCGIIYAALLTSRISSLEEATQVAFADIYDQLDTLEQPESMQAEERKGATKEKEVEGTKEAVPTSEEVLYHNEEYDFSLTFPTEWSDMHVTLRTLDWGSLETSPSFDFGFEAQDSLFNISIFTKSQWRDLKAQQQLSPTYLGENTTYVFGYSIAQDAANESLAERMGEVGEIVKTFTISE